MEKIQGLLINLLGKRDQWLPILGTLTLDTQALRDCMAGSLTRVIDDHIQQLQAVASREDMQALDELLQYALNQLQKTEIESSLAYWQAMANLLTTQQGEWRKRWTEKEGFPAKSSTKDKILQGKGIQKQRVTEIVAHLTDKYPTLLRLLKDVAHLPSTDLTEDQGSFFQAIGQILRVLVGSLQLVFQQRGQVDFIEMTLRALEALNNEDQASDIALFLDHRLQHLLIDEYQDTSYIQFQLFEKLIPNGSLAKDALFFSWAIRCNRYTVLGVRKSVCFCGRSVRA